MAKDAPITVAGNLPRADQYNGVNQVEDDLIADPEKLRYAVVAYDVDHTTYKTDSGKTTPTIRIRRIEPADGATAEEIRKLLDRISEGRLGALPLSEADEADEVDDAKGA